MPTRVEVQEAAEFIAQQQTPGWNFFSEETRLIITNGWVSLLSKAFVVEDNT